MLKTRLILIVICGVAIWLLFQLPKAVVENEPDLASSTPDSVQSHIQSHTTVPTELTNSIQQLRRQWVREARNQKNAIFADSLAELYRLSSRFDSAAWFSEDASAFFNSVESWRQAGDDYYQAYTIAIDPSNQKVYAAKAQEFFGKVLGKNPADLDVKTKMAMTYMTSSSPMKGIALLREVLAQDPNNELALFNMGMLSIQSGQNDRAIEWLNKLVAVNEGHIQGQLLLGLAMMNRGDKEGARKQFEKVKAMDKDPAVQSAVDSYLNDLK